jgi:hypothetical protein
MDGPEPRHYEFLAVIVDDFDVMRAVRTPVESDPVLVVDTNAELARSVAAQLLESTPGRKAQIDWRACGVDVLQFAPCGIFYHPETRHARQPEQNPGVLAFE